MAVILKRVGLALLLLAAAYTTFFRTRTPAPEEESDPRLQRLGQVNDRLRQATVHWSALAARDTILGGIAQQARAGVPNILSTGFPEAPPSPAALKLVRQRWDAVGRTDSSVRVAVMLYNDADYRALQNQVYPYSGALVRSGSSGEVCVAMTPGHLHAQGYIEIVKSELDHALAPCLLLAAFGRPGRGVRDWLNATRYASARSNAWLHRPKEILDGDGELPWRAMFDESWSDAYAMYRSSFLTGLSAVQIALMLVPPYQMGAPALHCLTGNETECANSVLDSVRLAPGMPTDLTYPWRFELGRRRGILEPHPIGMWWLSDLIREEGRERFSRFWKSDRPFELAFREAFDEELGAWTREWGIRQRTRSSEEENSTKQVILGASLKPSWPLLALGWTAVAILMAAWTAKRRQVTP